MNGTITPQPAGHPASLGEALTVAAERLIAAGLSPADARRDARLLVAEAAEALPQTVFAYPERPLAAEARERWQAFIARRAAREPVSRILGRRGFWDLEFLVTPAVLDPRPDSETLVEAALTLYPDESAALDVLDLGTGSGCLLLALLGARPAARGLGTDASDEALAVAQENARRNGLDSRSEFRRGDWAEGLADSSFDLVICNPPYIGGEERPALAPEVRAYDPAGALFAGEEGIACYRAVAPQAARVLRPGGWLVFELGQGQAGSVKQIVCAAGFEGISTRQDLGGHDRALLARRPSVQG